jgi:peptidoglycan/LPS O-acetylase OafA/YrhL
MTTDARRYDLDALRVGAFLLLILYHLGMFYVPWGWHVKSTHVVPALDAPMGLLNPWRLTLLFVISGTASRFMLGKLAPGTFAAQRSWRLLVPLLFGMLVIVPPQSWAEVVEKAAYTGGYLAFWGRYLSFDQSFGIILPTYNHLWFVAYLWLYTLLAALLAPVLPVFDRALGRGLAGPAVFVAPVAVFGALRAFVFPVWGETHIIWADPYNHLHYGAAFLIGMLLARQDEAWDRMARARHVSLIATAAIALVGVPLSGVMEDQPDWRGVAFAVVREVYAWGVIVTLFGYARRHIRQGSPLLTTLTEAVFPFYIVHQTVIVLAGHFLKPTGLPLWMEAGTILTMTVVTCVGAYGLARAAPMLRPLFGMKS